MQSALSVRFRAPTGARTLRRMSPACARLFGSVQNFTGCGCREPNSAFPWTNGSPCPASFTVLDGGDCPMLTAATSPRRAVVYLVPFKTPLHEVLLPHFHPLRDTVRCRPILTVRCRPILTVGHAAANASDDLLPRVPREHATPSLLRDGEFHTDHMQRPSTRHTTDSLSRLMTLPTFRGPPTAHGRRPVLRIQHGVPSQPASARKIHRASRPEGATGRHHNGHSHWTPAFTRSTIN